MVNLPIPQSLEKECIKAANILNSFVNPGASGTDKFIPPDILANAKGIAFLTVLKAGFIWSGRVGSGLVVARLPNGTWSAPSAIGTAGAGVGGQIGAEMTDFVMILNTESAVKSFGHGGNLTLGGNVTVAAGPLGRSAEASGAVRNFAAVFSYSKSRGLFAGVSLEGSVILERKDANQKMYGRPIRAMELLTGGMPPPPQADALYRSLNLKAAPALGTSFNSQTSTPAAYGTGTYGAGGYGANASGPASGPYGGTSSAYGANSSYASTPVAGGGGQSYLNRSISEVAKPADPPVYGGASTYGAGAGTYGSNASNYGGAGANTYGAGTNTYGTSANTYGSGASNYGGTSTYGANVGSTPAYNGSASVHSGSDYHSGAVGDVKQSQVRPPPPPPPARAETAPNVVRAVAMYDFKGDQPDDLMFTKGDIIIVTKKTDTQDDWWQGKCNGRTGSFPANYVRLD
ncbi:hypothetical protein H4R99_006569 [Coemansia sp. RSA 1722]|nr:hypothetical protein IWW45_004364 [Coemansia sp. RSA 485]KAJ2591962.1 hypothetical protein H4R99_006569 [Coemansia sp. RSA 1722]